MEFQQGILQINVSYDWFSTQHFFALICFLELVPSKSWRRYIWTLPSFCIFQVVPRKVLEIYLFRDQKVTK